MVSIDGQSFNDGRINATLFETVLLISRLCQPLHYIHHSTLEYRNLKFKYFGIEDLFLENVNRSYLLQMKSLKIEILFLILILIRGNKKKQQINSKTVSTGQSFKNKVI